MKLIAIGESILADAGYGVRKVHGCQMAAIESAIADAGHAVWNNCVIAAGNQCVGAGFDDGVAVVARIIVGIACCHFNSCQVRAVTERAVAHGGHARRNGDRGQAGATFESFFTESCHAFL